jgi:hypothetical protein
LTALAEFAGSSIRRLGGLAQVLQYQWLEFAKVTAV